jgi:protein-tyrosine-phosphatase
MPRLILFVCEVNTGRSPMAAALFAALCAQRGLHDVTADSAGLTARAGELVPAPVQKARPQ